MSRFSTEYFRFIPIRHARKEKKANDISPMDILQPNLTFPGTVDDFLIGSSFQYLLILHQKVIYKRCSWELIQLFWKYSRHFRTSPWPQGQVPGKIDCLEPPRALPEQKVTNKFCVYDQYQHLRSPSRHNKCCVYNDLKSSLRQHQVT